MQYYSLATIVTTYLSPTSHRGSRIRVKSNFGVKTYSYPHSLSGADAHVFVLKEYLAHFNCDWGPSFAIGSEEDKYTFTPINNNVVWVQK